MWETPLIAAALSETKAGLPVKNGSISTAWPPKSSRKAEWPNQVICMAAPVLSRKRHDIIGRCRPRVLALRDARQNPAARRDGRPACGARRADWARPRQQDHRSGGE